MPGVGQPGVSAGTGAAQRSKLGAGDMGQHELPRLTTAGQPIGFCAALACPSPPWGTSGTSPPYGLLLRLSTLHSTCTVTPATQKFFGLWSLEPERLVIPISQLAECFRFFFQTTGIDDVEIHLFLIYRGKMVVQSLKYLPRNLAASTTNLNSLSWRPPKWGRPHNSVLGLCFCWWRLTALILAWLKILRLILNRPEIQTNPASSHPPCNSPRNYSVCKEPWL